MNAFALSSQTLYTFVMENISRKILLCFKLSSRAYTQISIIITLASTAYGNSGKYTDFFYSKYSSF